MLIELAVHDLGVISSLRLLLGPGMTALTGETGAGKTMLVEALELLVGGKADPALVRPGATEAVVEGRLLIDGTEVVLTRVVPAEGRSRAYVDGRFAPSAALAEWGSRAIDLHGQHAHQSLLAPAQQRAALDQFAGIDLGPLRAARAEVARIDEALAALGGDERSRAREIDLLRYQSEELAAAALDDPQEDRALEAEEDLLAGAQSHRDAAGAALEALTGDGAALDALGTAVGALSGHGPFNELEARLRDAVGEVSDIAAELRRAAEAIEDDPGRLEVIRTRRQLLRDLQRKYGDGLEAVIAYAEEVGRQLDDLEGYEARAAALDARRAEAVALAVAAARQVGAQRHAAADALAQATQRHLGELAMAKAKLAVAVANDLTDPKVGADVAGSEVTFQLAANPGSPLLPLAKVASGGELARTMLALRLVLTGVGDGSGPDTLVFDEVDAGIGGEAAFAVGRALARLGAGRQVLVVTHLPQVAAFAHQQVAVRKVDDGSSTTTTIHVLDEEERARELARMMTGQPDSDSARAHAIELLDQATSAAQP